MSEIRKLMETLQRIDELSWKDTEDSCLRCGVKLISKEDLQTGICPNCWDQAKDGDVELFSEGAFKDLDIDIQEFRRANKHLPADQLVRLARDLFGQKAATYLSNQLEAEGDYQDYMIDEEDNYHVAPNIWQGDQYDVLDSDDIFIGTHYDSKEAAQAQADKLNSEKPDSPKQSWMDKFKSVLEAGQEEKLRESFSGITYDAILDEYQSEEDALEYARGMVWSEVETTHNDIKYAENIGTVNGVDVYYDYGADYYFFAPAQIEEDHYKTVNPKYSSIPISMNRHQHAKFMKKMGKTRKKADRKPELKESFTKKIGCTKCDEVSTEKAWQKNDGTCPKCKASTQGVAENVNEARGRVVEVPAELRGDIELVANATSEDARKFLADLGPDDDVSHDVVDPETGELLDWPTSGLNRNEREDDEDAAYWRKRGGTKRQKGKHAAKNRDEFYASFNNVPSFYLHSDASGDVQERAYDLLDELRNSDFYNVVWRETADDVEDPEMMRDNDYDIDVEMPVLLKRKDGKKLTDEDHDNIKEIIKAVKLASTLGNIGLGYAGTTNGGTTARFHPMFM